MKNFLAVIIILSILLLTVSACRSGSSVTPQPTAEVDSAVLSEPQPTESIRLPDSSQDAACSIIDLAVKTTSEYFPRTLIGEIQSASMIEPAQVEMAFEDNGKYSFKVKNSDGSFFAGVVITPTVYINQMGIWQFASGETANGYLYNFRDLNQYAGDASILGTMMDPQFTGSEVVNGVETSIYSYEVTISEGVVSKAHLWIGDSDKLIYKYSVESTNGAHTLGTYDFSTTVAIIPPIEQTVASLEAVGMDLCSMLTPEVIFPLINRELSVEPVPFQDDYLGKGCSYDYGSDNTSAYFMYFSIAPISSYNDSKTNGSDVTPQPQLLEDSFTVNAADTQQLWVKLDEQEALVVVIGDQPNPEAAIKLANMLLLLIQLTPK